MTTHITARLAWHDDGWNGAICRKPERNTYCVGCKSYPGDVIARERDLALEQRLAGRAASKLEGYVPPCSYSYNAFGLDEAPAAANPPDFFFGGATRHKWSLPPATVSTWPYEAMYSDEVRQSGYLDNDIRKDLVNKFYKPIEDDCPNNLIFYYVNYSNPLSEDNAPRYVMIGVSRITQVSEERRYENVNENVGKRYAGGMIWARDISSAYPEEGVRLPYHRYRDDLETLESFAVIPERAALCKYGSKHLSDDDAIGLLEQFLAKVRLLKASGDISEDWNIREAWLLKSIAGLWKHRGLYPGLLTTLTVIGAVQLIDTAKALCIKQGHAAAHAAIFGALETGDFRGLATVLTPAESKKISRSWLLLEDGARLLLRDILPRLELSAEAMAAIASKQWTEGGVEVRPEEIIKNPYLLCELYCGEDASDRIPWGTIDRGVLPSPDVGAPLAGIDYNDAGRFRALCVEHLRQEPKHNFRLARDLIVEIAQRMERLPAWKQATFSERYFDVDANILSGALTLQSTDEGQIVYLKSVFEDERYVEEVLQRLVTRPSIELRRPLIMADWNSWVHKSGSMLAQQGGADYRDATREQAGICERLFLRPLSVVTGAAGTGKTTVIQALIHAVRRSEGEGANILVLAPTGKAADRAREVLEDAKLQRVETVTVHSFLARHGWLNDNLTFKRRGGKLAEVGTLVLDEASMLDLELAAALMRAVNWQTVRRLILVGDANQLPPIGRGRVFADVIRWLSTNYPESFGRLTINLRQLLTRARGEGSAIVELSRLFILQDIEITTDGKDDWDQPTSLAEEKLIERIHAGGLVDRDLDVVYWDDPQRLADTLIGAIETKMRGGGSDDKGRPDQLWRTSLERDPTAFQILTPHRGEMHGVEALNEACQTHIADFVISRVGAIDGITLNDKVIQICNRPKSNPIWAYDNNTREKCRVEIFNGEIGIVRNFGFDNRLWETIRTGYGPRLKRFAVQFTRKPGITVGYGKDVPHGGRYLRNERVEDNLELAYAVSIHKAQGSEFAHTFVIIPASHNRPVSAELIYTALTRASRHCTLLIERDITSLLNARRRENAQTPQINSSMFGYLHLAKQQLLERRSWYESGKIHEALTGDMLRSKSEVIIANLLHERGIPFRYEQPLFAGDGTIKLPDFTVTIAGRTFFWEHLGMLDQTNYAEDWAAKEAWYQRWFPGQLVTTKESGRLSRDAEGLVTKLSSAA
ncbi:ATP-dependent DNA helicase [Oleomonas cavernae]|nr:AAA family ATPase [Oleomonas cavernae]